MDVSQLEPAERNPKREILTLVSILLIAFVAGGLILYNYISMRTRQNEMVKEGRSPEIGELVKNYSFKNKKDENASFFDLTGQVTLVACISAKQLEDSEVVTNALKNIVARFENEDRVKILFLSLDDEKDLPVKDLITAIESLGLPEDKWDLAASNGDLFLAYIKKQMKFIHLSAQKTEGKWRVPQRIRVIGPDLKIRGREGEYDFGKVVYDIDQAKMELANNEKFKQDERYQGDVSKLEADMLAYVENVIAKSIHYMLDKEEFDKAMIDEGKKKNIYEPYLYLFGGFILFLIIFGMKVRRKQLANS